MNPLFALLYNRLPIFAKLYDEFEHLYWSCHPDRVEMAKLRIAAHDKAMREGYQSPYTDPDNYDSNWNLIIKRHP